MRTSVSQCFFASLLLLATVAGSVRAEPPSGPRYAPLQYTTDMWQGSTYWAGPDWARVGKDWQHPGRVYPSVRRLVVPKAGKLSITGRAYKLDTKGGDGVIL